MVKSYTGTALVDKRLQIAKADQGFYNYVGSENYASIAGCFPSDGLPYFRQIVGDLGIGESFTLVVRMRTAGGQYHHVLTELMGVSVKDGAEVYVEVKIQDIEELQERLCGVCDENQVYSELIDMWGEELFTYDTGKDSMQIFSGSATNRVYSFRGTLDEFREMWFQKIVDEAVRADFLEFCNNIKNGTKNFECRLELPDELTDGQANIRLLKGRTVENTHKEQIVFGCVLRSGADGAVESVLNDTDKDVTTGLLSKRVVLEYTENLLKRKPKYNVNLCVIDVDNFKQVNDTLGHMFGDEVLARVADILKDAVAGKGVVGRIGGDEMFVVLEGVNNLSDLRGILRTIRNNVEWAYKERKDVPPITCSIGVSTYPADGYIYDDLFKIADKMLYLAKQKGKNRYIVYAPEVHGDVLSEGENVSVMNSASRRQDKEELVLKMLEYVARQTNRPFDMLLKDIGEAFGLEEVRLSYGNEKKVLLESKWSMDGEVRLDRTFSECIHEENFVHLYRGNNAMAVIDKPEPIELLCPKMYKYMVSRGIRTALVYKMDCKQHEGYIAYCKMSDMSRKWSDSDLTNLTYISKILELVINDR